jgi:hypothetical protein
MLTAQLVKRNGQPDKIAVNRFPEICHLAKNVIFDPGKLTGLL